MRSRSRKGRLFACLLTLTEGQAPIHCPQAADVAVGASRHGMSAASVSLESMVTRDEAIKGAAKVLARAAERIEREEREREAATALLTASAKRIPGAPGKGVEAVRLYTVSEAAKILSTSTDYVYKRFEDGELPRVQLGNGRSKYRVRADHLQRFIDDRSFGI